MHVLIVDGHPDRSDRRFCHALATAYAEGAKQSGHDVRVITIAEMDVPLLRSQDEWTHGTLPPQLKEPQDALKWADHLVIIYLARRPAGLSEGFSRATCATRFRLYARISLPESRTT
jgi:putative NADPH-quinone reductase